MAHTTHWDYRLPNGIVYFNESFGRDSYSYGLFCWQQKKPYPGAPASLELRLREGDPTSRTGFMETLDWLETQIKANPHARGWLRPYQATALLTRVRAATGPANRNQPAI